MNRNKLLVVLMILGLGMFSGLFAQVNITIGDGTSYNGTSSVPTPYGTYYKNFRQQFLYTANEIEAAGGGAGPINSLAFNVSSVNNCSPMPNFTIRIKTTDQSVLSSTFEDGTYTEVFYENDFLPVEGMNVHAFNTPFEWDGTSNILVDIVTSIIPGTYSENASVFYTSTGFNSSLRYQNDSSEAINATTGTLSQLRSNITFNMSALQITDPPSAANLIYPGNGVTILGNSVTLQWSAGGGLPTGYKLYFDTVNPPAFLADLGNETSYDAADLTASTTYYWQVVPYNDHGDAIDAPVWSFNTLAEGQLAESFEESVPPVGWVSLGSTSWTRSTANSTHGSASAYKYGSTTDQYILSTPMLDISAGDMMSFDLRVTDASVALELVYSTDRDNWILLDESYVDTASTWQSFTVDLSDAAGGHYIGFRTSLGNAAFYLDAVTGPGILPQAPGVPMPLAPADGAVGVTEYTTFNWGPSQLGGIPTGYNLYLDTVDGSTLFASNVMPPYTLETPLNYLTTYYWTIEAINDIGTSDFPGVRSFTTRDNPAITTFPWNVDFGTEAADWMPLNWSQASGIFPTIDGNLVQWVRDDWLNGTTGNNAAKINIYGSNRKGWLITPPVVIPADGYELKFDLGLTDYGSSNPIDNPDSQEDDKFIVAMATNHAMTDAVILREWNNVDSDYVFNEIPNTGTEVSIVLNDVVGPVYFIFYGESTQSNGDNDLFVDNVTVRELPAAPILAVSPLSMDFGSLTQGVESQPINLIISNNGSGTLNVNASEITISGPNASMFAFDDTNLPAALEAGASVTVPVTATVTVEGPVTATLTIDNAQTNTTIEIALSAEGNPEGLVFIGDGSVNQKLPINPFFGFTYSQSIFLQSEINMPSQRIEKIYYHWNGAGEATVSNNWVIYMGHTDLSEFDTNEWIPAEDLVEVFNGFVDLPAENGWIEILLNTPFTYNNVDNLVIAVDENAPGYDTSSLYFYNTNTDTARSLRYYSDTINPDPASPPVATVVSAIPNIILEFGDMPIEPVLAISPTTWNFGNQIINTSHTKTFNIMNSGAGTLNVETVVVSGDAFTLDEPFTAVSLEGGESSEITVVYQPTEVGTQTGNIVVTAGDQEITVELSGSCYNPIISTFPWTEDFGTEPSEWMPPEWSQITRLYPDGTSSTSTQWLQDDWLNISDPVNKAAKINVYGSARHGWLITPPINITDGDYELNFDLGLTVWNQTTAVDPTLQQAQRFLVIMGTDAEMSDPVILREWNNTGSDYVYNEIPNTGMNVTIPLTDITGMFYISFYAESTTAGGDVDLMVDNVTIQEATNTETPIFAIDPTSYDFGNVLVGETATQSFTVSNAGDGTLTVSSIGISGSEMMSLSGLPTLPANLTAGQSFSFNVVYAPTAVGTHDATVTLQDNIVRELHTVALTGVGVAEAPDDLYPPSNLAGYVIENDVHLSWDAPVPPPTGDWVTWCNPNEIGTSIGTNSAAIFDVAHRYTPSDLADYQGRALTHVQFVPAEANCTYSIKVWTGGSISGPANLVHTQQVTAPIIGQWNTVELTNPIPIPENQDFWFGFESNTQGGHPAGCDNGPAIAGKGNMINLNGWSQLAALNPELDYNWSIQGYLDSNFDRVLMPAPIAEAPRAPQKGTLNLHSIPSLRMANTTATRESELIGYKVYRDGVLMETVDNPETLEYVDNDVDFGTYEYTVTAIYDAGESVPTDPIEIIVEDFTPPIDLAYTVNGNDVTLDWTSPQPEVDGEWISWSDNSAIGNGIGTNSVANFDVAHRYDANDLADYVGSSLIQVKFVPMFQNAIYTVKIWTGGSTTVPGELILSQVVTNHVIEDWNTVYLNTPVNITSGMQLWIGYNVNTQGGYPAGCDNGPQVEGKGNIMNMGGWTTLSQVNAELTFNWLIQGFVADNMNTKAISLPAIAETPTMRPQGELAMKHITPSRNHDRGFLLGYKVYRDGALIAQISNPTITSYTDHDLPNGDYVYGVSAVYHTGESPTVTVDVNVNLEIAETIFSDSFEEYPDFATGFDNWILLDQDSAPTYGFSNITFPGSENPMAYIIFNPSQTVPPIEGMDPLEGDKFAASFAAVNVTNNDWLITERVSLGSNSSLKFNAKSFTDVYGYERFRVGVSTFPTINPNQFMYVSGANYVEAPTNWTEYNYDLSAYDGQQVYIGIRCVSDNAFVFMVDNFSIHSDGGVANEDIVVPSFANALQGNYPNPFNPETTIRYSLKEASDVSIEIYNLKGQLVNRLVDEHKAAGEHSVVWKGTDMNNRPVSSGVYFYKMNTGKFSATKKMIMMK
nr:large repetitive protein [Candidatus Cloacimonadota bacterium]